MGLDTKNTVVQTYYLHRIFMLIGKRNHRRLPRGGGVYTEFANPR